MPRLRSLSDRASVIDIIHLFHIQQRLELVDDVAELVYADNRYRVYRIRTRR